MRVRAAGLGAAVLSTLVAVTSAAARELASEHRRWAMWVPVGFGAGAALYFAWPDEPMRGASPLIALAAAWTAVSLRRPALRAVAIAVLVTALGFAFAQLRTADLAAPKLERERAAVVEGTILARSGGAGEPVRLLMDVSHIGELPEEKTPARVRVSVRGQASGLEPGDAVRVRAVLRPPPTPSAPGAYDFARWAYFERIGAVGYAISRPERIARAESGWWTALEKALARLRFAMTQNIAAQVPGPEGAIAAALITGERGFISDTDMEALRDSGLAHVISISGLHMAMVGMGLYGLLRQGIALWPWLVLRIPAKKWAAAAALVTTFAYLLLSGASVPAQRAFVMVALAFIAIMADRSPISMRGVAIAAAIILILEPEAVLDPSFQMSFGAVAALVAAYEAWQSRKSVPGPAPLWRRPLNYAAGLSFTSLVAGLATAPMAAYHFNRLAAYGLAGNVIAMPVVGMVVMPAAALAAIAMPIGWEYWPLQAMGWGVGLMLDVAHWVASWPGAAAPVRAMPAAAFAAIVAGGLWLVLWTRPWRLLGLVPIVSGFAAAALTLPPDLLVGRDGAVALRASDGRLMTFGADPDSYESELWLRRDGDVRVSGEAPAREGVRCDALGCRIETAWGGRSRIVAIVRKPEALAEDCAAADIVISLSPARGRCRGPARVIDRWDILRQGAHALWFDDSLTMETVQAHRGARPWSTQ